LHQTVVLLHIDFWRKVASPHTSSSGLQSLMAKNVTTSSSWSHGLRPSRSLQRWYPIIQSSDVDPMTDSHMKSEAE